VNRFLGRGVHVGGEPTELQKRLTLDAVEAVFHDHLAHGERDRNIGPGLYGNPFGGLRGGIGQPHIEGHHPDATIDHGAHQAVGHGGVVRMSFQTVRAEVKNEARVVEVPVVVVGAPGQLLSGPLRSLANGRVVAHGAGAVVGQKQTLDQLAGAGLHAPVMEHELLWMSFVTQRLQAAGNFAQGLIPRHPLPLALAAGADPAQRIEHAVRIVDLVDPRLSLGAERALRADRVKLSADLDQLAVFHIADDWATAHALPAGTGHRRTFLAGAWREVLAALEQHGLAFGGG
jgi:hypothetical protein